ncbi:hypothetical protein EB001_13675 [bacterium]|nr:hypothetical protein [bacterium]
MSENLKRKQLEAIKSGYSHSKELAKEIWIEGDHEGNSNDFYYFQCGFVAGLNYKLYKDYADNSELRCEHCYRIIDSYFYNYSCKFCYDKGLR